MSQKSWKFTRVVPDFSRLFLEIVKTESSILILSEEDSNDCARATFALSWILRIKYPRLQTKIFIVSENKGAFRHLKFFNQVRIDTISESHREHYRTICTLGVSPENKLTLTLRKRRSDNTHESLEIEEGQLPTLTELVYRAFVNDSLIKNTDARALLYETTQDPSHLLRFNESPLHISVLVEEIFDLLPRTPEAFLSIRKQLSYREISLVSEFLQSSEHQTFKNWPRATSFFLSRSARDKWRDAKFETEEAAFFTLSHFGTLTYGSVWSMLLYPLEGGAVQVILRTENEQVKTNRILEAMNIGTGSARISSGTFGRSMRTLEPEMCLRELLHYLHGHEYDPILDKLIDAPYEFEIEP